MSVIIYTRTSTKDQTLGHEAQINKCLEWANDRSLSVSGIYSDTTSGTKRGIERSGFQSALNVLKAGDTLVTWKRDRLGRNSDDIGVSLYFIESKGASFISIDDRAGNSASDRLFNGMKSRIAE